MGVLFIFRDRKRCCNSCHFGPDKINRLIAVCGFLQQVNKSGQDENEFWRKIPMKNFCKERERTQGSIKNCCINLISNY